MSDFIITSGEEGGRKQRWIEYWVCFAEDTHGDRLDVAHYEGHQWREVKKMIADKSVVEVERVVLTGPGDVDDVESIYRNDSLVQPCDCCEEAIDE
tara:strand:+ start:6586 stop:6873 length:288 start_codon:yes stop_codon:yes gene_type:complete